MTCPVLIAHRGNTVGPDPANENNPDYLREAIEKGFQVEVDVWHFKYSGHHWKGAVRGFYSGHDTHQYRLPDPVSPRVNRLYWSHAKNVEALRQLVERGAEHAFFHQNDDFTLTTCNRIWTYPGRELTARSICVMPERDPKFDLKDPRPYFATLPYAICSDYVVEIRDNWKD